MKIMGVLQNAWFRPGTPERFIKLYHEDQRLMQTVLARSHSGKRLIAALGLFLFREITWTEASPVSGSRSGHVSPADPEWIRKQLEQFKPDVVVTFGTIASKALPPLWSGPLIQCTHPADRLQKRFLESAKQLTDYLKGSNHHATRSS